MKDNLQSPFPFGTLATKQILIDRIADRAQPKQLLYSHINVMLVSPRRRANLRWLIRWPWRS